MNITNENLLIIYKEHRNSIYRLALSYTHSIQDAEDITQAVFLKLMEKQPKLVSGKERAWLTQVTVNTCKDLLKSSWKQKRNDFDDISDNKIYFVLDDICMDITKQCSATTSFRHDMIDKNGLKHIIFVGGTPDNVGWAEYIFDTDGTYLTNLMHVPVTNPMHIPSWLTDAEVSIGVPTGIPEIDFAE